MTKFVKELTEDEVRDEAKVILGLRNNSKAKAGVGQLTTFNKLGFRGVIDKPDGWYLPNNHEEVAIILETKNSNENIEKYVYEIKKNCKVVLKKYNKVIGILYNGYDIKVYKNNDEADVVDGLKNKEYYLSLFNTEKIDKQKIYGITKKINDSLHKDFGIKNLYHRMIFTACALVAKRFGATFYTSMNYATFQTCVRTQIESELKNSIRRNNKLNILLDVYSEIKPNSIESQTALDNFILNISKISDCINQDNWNGEDVMGIFFNEFNRYKKKSESGQVFTPEHITQFMYRLIDVHKDDNVLDAACGSGGFLVKAMSRMINEAGKKTKKANKIMSGQLFGIEMDREIYALACANMLIHDDGKTNLEQLDSREETASKWIKSKKITKVLMNPPFERAYGCLKIVKNVLDSVQKDALCAFILPDKKLEKDNGEKILKYHRLLKIIKLPEKVFREGVTTSIFIFKAHVPQNDKEIFSCYVENDGLETVKNQGRQDIKDRWQEIEDKFVKIIDKQQGDKTIQWLKPSMHLSYQMPEKRFEISEQDFIKTMTDYILFKKGINVKDFSEKIIKNVLYKSEVIKKGKNIQIKINNE